MTDQDARSKEFDAYAANYRETMRESTKGLGYDAYFDEYKIREIRDFLKSIHRDGEGLCFLNFGCGIGSSEPYIRKYFPNAKISSIDISTESIKAAAENNKGLQNIEFKVFDGINIPFETSFDVVLIANVLHHIPFDQHIIIARSILSKLNTNGFLFVFEHNPYNPVTRKIVNACAFDKNAVLLNPRYCSQMLGQIGFAWKSIRFTLFFPKFLRFLRPLERFLRITPFGAQYYFVCRK
jgi:SAM-dependent methyltransferase